MTIIMLPLLLLLLLLLLRIIIILDPDQIGGWPAGGARAS